MRTSLTLLLLAAVATGTACSKETNMARSFYSEAGSGIESRGFGEATAQNMAVQSSEQSYAVNLTRKFGADVTTTVHFAFNSSVLDSEAQQTLMRQADWIRQFPEIRFRVYGHTDLVGSNAYNKALGMRRAQAVVAFLSTQGISRSRLEAVVSYGKTQPLVYVQSPNRENRRTVTEVSGFVTGNKRPAHLNGKYAAVIFREYVASATPKVVTSSGAMPAAQAADTTGGG